MSPKQSKPASLRRLAADFGPASELARQAVRTLYAAVSAADWREAAAALPDGKRAPAGACGDFEKGAQAVAALAQSYGLSLQGLHPARLLLAVESYYALLLRLLVRHVAPSVTAWGASEEEEDPLSWSLRAGSRPVSELVNHLAERIASHQRAALLAPCDRGHDLLQDLYQQVFPRRFRHAAGEYYTPSWLAGEMLDEAGYSGPGWDGSCTAVPDDAERARQCNCCPNAAEGNRGPAGLRLLDPACGSGAFLILAIRRLRSQCRNGAGGRPTITPLSRFGRGAGGEGTEQSKHEVVVERPLDADGLLKHILSNVVGFDRNPLAVLTAKANYLLALSDLLPGGPIEVPVYCCDSILGRGEPAALRCGRFDCVVGNPPWIAWDNLPAEYREATKPLWQQYGLFSLSASEARHGGGKKDLSMLMTYVAADRYLKDSGRLAMVITQTLFQTKGAGDGFRRFRLGAEGAWLQVLRVNDLVAVRPFPGAANWTATILLEKGRPTQYPVPYARWLPDSRREQYEASPIDPERPTSPWFLRPQGWKDPKVPLVGPSDYQAHLGANSGGANGVYWVTLVDHDAACATASQKQGPPPHASTACLTASSGTPPCVWIHNVAGRGKRSVPSVEHLVEAELLYPLLRWADVARYRAVPRDYWLFVQDAQTRKGIEENLMRRRCPHAHSYLEQFHEVLAGRAAYRRYQNRAAFYSMYDVGPYTLAPIKVVWRRMDRRITAAVVEPLDDSVLGPRPVIPQETCVLIAADGADEAHYLCALLNSAVVGFLVASYSVRGGKGFGTPSMLDYIRLRRFDPDNSAHRDLAALSREAHQRAARREDYSDLQRDIDCLADELWRIGQGVGSLLRRKPAD